MTHPKDADGHGSASPAPGPVPGPSCGGPSRRSMAIRRPSLVARKRDQARRHRATSDQRPGTRDGRRAARGASEQTPATRLAFEPADRDLLSVYEFAMSGYHFIALEGVLAVRFAGRQYRIIP